MSQDAYLLGQLAVHYKLVTADRLAELMREEAKREFQRTLGEALVDEGLLHEQQLQKLLEVQRQLKEKAAAKATAAAAVAAEPEVPTASTGRDADRLLAYAVESGASDLHVATGERLLLRRHGELAAVGEDVFELDQVERLLAELLSDRQLEQLRVCGQIDFAATLAGRARFRGNAYRFQDGLAAVLRVIPLAPPTLNDLGLPSTLARLTAFHQGIVLLTGPSGCGKSSTLAALLRLVNEERRDHIVTIEDPIEFLHPPLRCSVNQRQVGRDTESFARALKAALREDPDVIAIGELRDLETISLALTAAETGHLVLATLHTGSAIRTIDRVIGAFPPDQQPQIRTMFSESLRAIVSQRLLARADGAGRVAAMEILYGTRAVANLIRDRKTFQLRSILQTGGALGMTLLDNSLAALVRAGTVTLDEARRHAEDPRALAAA